MVENGGSKRLVFLALLLALGIALHLIESIYMPPLPIPGAKLGLANIVSLIIISSYSLREAAVNALARTLIASILLGTFLSATFVFSLSGALVSTIVMLAAHRSLSKHLSLSGISILGALAHNLTQMIVAYFIFIRHSALFFELPILMVLAVLCGLFNGVLASLILSRALTPAGLRASSKRPSFVKGGLD
ncbi:MAG: Gx transporter family protein [Actinomycetota bacterium]|nr:Gx transporter family protein [Actinomycetota bacterium]